MWQGFELHEVKICVGSPRNLSRILTFCCDNFWNPHTIYNCIIVWLINHVLILTLKQWYEIWCDWREYYPSTFIKIAELFLIWKKTHIYFPLRLIWCISLITSCYKLEYQRTFKDQNEWFCMAKRGFYDGKLNIYCCQISISRS